MDLFIPRRPLGERGDNFIGSSYTSHSPFTASCLLIAIMQSQELDFRQMTVLSDRQVPLAVWVAQPTKKNVGSGSTVRPDRLTVEKMRPGSIVVSGNKKRRPAHTETRRFRNERVHSTPSVGRKGRQFYRIFLYKIFLFYRFMSIK